MKNTENCYPNSQKRSVKFMRSGKTKLPEIYIAYKVGEGKKLARQKS